MSTSEATILAFMQISDEEFLVGIGATRQDALEAMLEDPGISDLYRDLARRPDRVEYLPLARRATGWSTNTGLVAD